MDEYIILNKTTIQKRIEELKYKREVEPDNYTQSYLDGKIKQLEQILSQSTSLIPEIEKAFGLGAANNANGKPLLSDYISNLKLDI